MYRGQTGDEERDALKREADASAKAFLDHLAGRTGSGVDPDTARLAAKATYEEMLLSGPNDPRLKGHPRPRLVASLQDQPAKEAEVAARRGRMDEAVAGLLFQVGLRRSENRLRAATSSLAGASARFPAIADAAAGRMRGSRTRVDARPDRVSENAQPPVGRERRIVTPGRPLAWGKNVSGGRG